MGSTAQKTNYSFGGNAIGGVAVPLAIAVGFFNAGPPLNSSAALVAGLGLHLLVAAARWGRTPRRTQAHSNAKIYLLGTLGNSLLLASPMAYGYEGWNLSLK